MFKKEENLKIKKSIDFEKAVMTRMDALKSTHSKNISYSAIVNEVLENTLCMDENLKKLLISTCTSLLTHLKESLSNCDKVTDLFWAQSYEIQIQQLESFIEILEFKYHVELLNTTK